MCDQTDTPPSVQYESNYLGLELYLPVRELDNPAHDLDHPVHELNYLALELTYLDLEPALLPREPAHSSISIRCVPISV
jgi:hypothetical protein